MVIKKLNSLFYKHSRVLFGAFTLLIILAFTDFLTPGKIGGCDDAGSTQVGTAFGEKVTTADLQKFHRDLSLAVMILHGSTLRDMGWEQLFQQYCIIRRAEQLGIFVTDEEIARELAGTFAENGKFSQEKYDKFLRENRVTDAEVASAVRLIMTTQKLQQSIVGSVVVTDAEAESFYRLENVGLEVDVCNFDGGKFQVDAGSPEALKEYYEANKTRYIKPGSIDAAVVTVPYSAFTAQAEKEITPAVIAEFRKTLAGASDADVKKMAVEVKAAELASAKANTLFRDLYDKLSGDGKSGDLAAADQLRIFEKWASDNGLVMAVDRIGFGAKSIGGEYAPEICRELQSMPGTGIQVTRPAAGMKAVCVAMLKQRSEPEQQSFAEVKAKVASDRLRDNRIKAARAFAANQAKSLAGKSAAEKEKLFKGFGNCERRKVLFPMTEKAMTEAKDMTQNNIIHAAALRLAAGEVSDALDVENGALLIRVAKRSPADMKKFDAQKPMLKDGLRSVKMQTAYMDFLNSIMRQCRYTLKGGNGNQAD